MGLLYHTIATAAAATTLADTATKSNKTFGPFEHLEIINLEPVRYQFSTRRSFYKRRVALSFRKHESYSTETG